MGQGALSGQSMFQVENLYLNPKYFVQMKGEKEWVMFQLTFDLNHSIQKYDNTFVSRIGESRTFSHMGIWNEMPENATTTVFKINLNRYIHRNDIVGYGPNAGRYDL